MSLRSIVHHTAGLARPCNANDMFTVSGGLQCGNCLAHNVEPPSPRCTARTADDRPCPLAAETHGLCWIHLRCREPAPSASS